MAFMGEAMSRTIRGLPSLYLSPSLSPALTATLAHLSPSRPPPSPPSHPPTPDRPPSLPGLEDMVQTAASSLSSSPISPLPPLVSRGDDGWGGIISSVPNALSSYASHNKTVVDGGGSPPTSGGAC